MGFELGSQPAALIDSYVCVMQATSDKIGCVRPLGVSLKVARHLLHRDEIRCGNIFKESFFHTIPLFDVS